MRQSVDKRITSFICLGTNVTKVLQILNAMDAIVDLSFNSSLLNSFSLQVKPKYLGWCCLKISAFQRILLVNPNFLVSQPATEQLCLRILL